MAGRDQPRRARLQPRPRVPARRRADRARDRVEDHGRPEPRDALLGPPRPGASRTCSWALGAYVILRGDAFGGMWFLVLGWFLAQAARGAVVSSRFSERLEGVTVADVMDTQPVDRAGRAERRSTPRTSSSCATASRGSRSSTASGASSASCARSRVEGAVERRPPGDHGRRGPRTADPDADSLVRRETPIEQLLGSETLRRLGALMVVDSEQRLCGVVTIEQVRRALAAAVPGPDRRRLSAATRRSAALRGRVGPAEPTDTVRRPCQHTTS